jgi:hypothetical protein
MFFVEQLDGDIPALDGIELDRIPPLEELVIPPERTTLQRDVAVLLHTGHFDLRVFLAGTIPVLNDFRFNIQAGYLGESYGELAAPLDLEVKFWHRIFSHDSVFF